MNANNGKEFCNNILSSSITHTILKYKYPQWHLPLISNVLWAQKIIMPSSV